MTILEENILNYQSQLKVICKKHHVNKLFFFGSINTTNFKSDSDVDLIVELEKMEPVEHGEELLVLWNEFENLFQRKVDLLTSTQKIKNPIFLRNIESSKHLFYDRAS